MSKIVVLWISLNTSSANYWGSEVPALEPARLENGSAGPRRHAVTETVAFGAPAVVGLERALHDVLLVPVSTLREPADGRAAHTCAGTEQG